MSALMAWLVVMELSFVGCALLAAALEMNRRERFWLRFALSLLGLVAGLAVFAAAVTLRLLPESLLLPLWLALAAAALIVGLRCCYRTAGGSPPGPSGHDDGGPLPPNEPGGPRGGLLLPDAAQAAARVRDHWRPKLTELGPRRPAREPEHLPVRQPDS
ncbi:MAG TPA: hypothetical protein VFP55_10735 [Solirubrobacteraceae bacterium]|nr:hypothetical protein [Solirubrobacteraceae bacterium]